ncbi:MAG: protein-L-isoaspartate(D-aspartate) O-methyltransferase [Deltaproteobacteria bacterium]|nr:protein-L-isoaspartate(D-aspartate) O-methyltransferase [Deltaproteobacteria bacterium]
MDYALLRKRMVDEQIVARGLNDPRILEVMRRIPRHLFVEPGLAHQSYGDSPLPIGEGQTISQPYIVAYMLSSLGLGRTDKVLEIGMGSGYLTVLLSGLVEKVYAIERLRSLAIPARQLLDRMECNNVLVKIFDGSYGWPDAAPFDAIVVSAVASEEPPASLLEQLVVGGRLVIPLITVKGQHLYRITRHGDNDFQSERLLGCSFVKLVGRNGGRG